MELTYQLIFYGSLLLLVCILASVVSHRIGAPLLLIFLILGMALGEQGPGGIVFHDFQTAHLIGSLALAVILFDGGLRTRMATFRVALRPAVGLATLGVVITAAATGAFATWLFGLHWMEGLLLGAIVGSTDAAAVFGLLHSRGLELKERVAATLEIESGSNDPMAIFLTVLMIELLLGEHEQIGVAAAVEFVHQMGLGAVVGLAGGWLLSRTINRLQLTTQGLYPLLALGGGLLVFGATAVLGGSGFLAVYLAGIVVANRPLQASQNIRRFHDGFAWLAQITMFVMLGLLVVPTELMEVAVPAALVAVLLIFVARPLATLVCLAPLRFPWREQVFIAWVGLRGAVPIILATFPFIAGIELAPLLFNVAFFVVLFSLVVQGWTIAPAARLLGLEVPPGTGVSERIELDIPQQTDYEFVAYRIASDSPSTDKPVYLLRLPDSAQVLAVFRGARAMRHPERQILRAGDQIYLLAHRDEIPVLDRLFVTAVAPEHLTAQRFFGEFTLDGDIKLQDLAGVYEFEVPADSNAGDTLSSYLLRLFNNRAVVGDRVRIDHLQFTVRELDMATGAITKVGLKIQPRAEG